MHLRAGQALVTQDMLILSKEVLPRFLNVHAHKAWAEAVSQIVVSQVPIRKADTQNGKGRDALHG